MENLYSVLGAGPAGAHPPVARELDGGLRVGIPGPERGPKQHHRLSAGRRARHADHRWRRRRLSSLVLEAKV